MRKIPLSFILFISLGGFSQVMTEFGPGGGDRQGSIIFYGSEGFNNRIPYENIKGIPYWSNDYQPAKLYAPLNKLYGTFFCRMNLATMELEYVNSKDEVVAAYPDQLSRAVFLSPKDSNRIVTVFRNDIPEVNLHYAGRNKRYYAQEMNQGPVKLLKICVRELRSGDSMLRTLKRYYFVDENEYFIETQSKVNKLRKLEKEEVMQYLPQPPALEGWIRDNKIRFNREEDVVRLLEYYNQATVKKE